MEQQVGARSSIELASTFRGEHDVTAWGPPGFFMIETGAADTPAIYGALQQRREIVDGERLNGFECTIAVPDIEAAERAVIAAGGTILMPRATIPTVGHMFWFRDSEGNIAGAMQPDPNASVER